jgi:hypothetical protein
MEELEAGGYRVINREVERRAENLEYEIRRTLAEMTVRLNRLNETLNERGVWSVAQDVEHSTGASGPIGSQWEKLIAASSQLVMLSLVGIEKQEESK